MSLPSTFTTNIEGRPGILRSTNMATADTNRLRKAGESHSE